MTKVKANSGDWIGLIAQMLPYLIQLIMALIASQQVTPAQTKKLRASLKELKKYA